MADLFKASGSTRLQYNPVPESPPPRRATRIRSGRVAGLCPAARTTRPRSEFPFRALRRGALLLGFAAGLDPECSLRRHPITNLALLASHRERMRLVASVYGLVDMAGARTINK